MFYPETWQSAGVTESTDQPGGITAQYPPVCSGQAPSHGPQYRQTVRNGLYFGHKPLKYQTKFQILFWTFHWIGFLTLLIYSIYFIYRYRERNNEGSRSNTSTFYLLLDLLTFFDSYHEGNVDEAFEVHRIFLVYNFVIFFLKIWYIWISSICMCKLVIHPDILDFSV